MIAFICRYPILASFPFLRSALQQPQIEIDIDSTFVLNANTGVWELN